LLRIWQPNTSPGGTVNLKPTVNTTLGAGTYPAGVVSVDAGHSAACLPSWFSLTNFHLTKVSKGSASGTLFPTKLDGSSFGTPSGNDITVLAADKNAGVAFPNGGTASDGNSYNDAWYAVDLVMSSVAGTDQGAACTGATITVSVTY
jgi:hypothetical protein